MENKPDNLTKRKITRSPSYPALSLEEAVGKAEIIWENEQRHYIPFESVEHHWRSKGGLTVHRILAALVKFGLLESSGKGAGKKYRVTNLLITILNDEDKKWQAVKDAALMPEIYNEIWGKYQGHLPSDTTLKSFLIVEKGFNKTVVDDFIEVFRKTILFANLSEDDILNPLNENQENGEISNFDKKIENVSIPVVEKSIQYNQHQQKEQQPKPIPMSANTLPIPLQIGFAQIPIGMSESDYQLLTNSLELWKSRLVKDSTNPFSIETEPPSSQSHSALQE